MQRKATLHTESKVPRPREHRSSFAEPRVTSPVGAESRRPLRAGEAKRPLFSEAVAGTRVRVGSPMVPQSVAKPLLTASASLTEPAPLSSVSQSAWVSKESRPIALVSSSIASSAQPIIASSTQPIIASSAQPIIASSTQPIIASSTQPIIASSAQPIIASSAQPIIASSAQPIIASSAQPIIASSTQPIIPSTQPIIPSTQPTPLVSGSPQPIPLVSGTPQPTPLVFEGSQAPVPLMPSIASPAPLVSTLSSAPGTPLVRVTSNPGTPLVRPQEFSMSHADPLISTPFGLHESGTVHGKL